MKKWFCHLCHLSQNGNKFIGTFYEIPPSYLSKKKRKRKCVSQSRDNDRCQMSGVIKAFQWNATLPVLWKFKLYWCLFCVLILPPPPLVTCPVTGECHENLTLQRQLCRWSIMAMQTLTHFNEVPLSHLTKRGNECLNLIGVKFYLTFSLPHSQLQ